MTHKLKDTLVGFAWITLLFGVSFSFLLTLPKLKHKEEPLSLFWPTEQGIQWTLKGSFSLSHEDPFEQKQKRYTYLLELNANPTNQEDPYIYKVSLNNLKIHDSDNRLLLSYEGNSFYSTSYYLAPEYSEVLRKNLDISLDSDLSEDFSLLHQPFRLALSSKGEILQIELSRKWHALLSELSHSTPFYTLLSNLLSKSTSLPSLTSTADPKQFTYQTKKVENSGDKSWHQEVKGSLALDADNFLEEFKMNLTSSYENALYSSSSSDLLSWELEGKAKLLENNELVKTLDIERELRN